MYSVYGLQDPRDESIRYIGMSRNVWRRYAMHLLIPSKTTTAKNAWIEELRKLDLSPLLVVLETMETEGEANKKEMHWIKHYLGIDAPLINIVKTGKTFPNRKKPDKLDSVAEATGLPDVKHFTVEELATASGVAPETIRRYIKRKELTALLIGGVYRIPADAYDQFKANRTSTSEKRSNSPKES